MSWTHACRLLGLAGVTLFLLIAYTPLPNLLSRELETPSHIEQAEAVVVLGSGHFPDGLLTDASLRRAIHGIVLHRKGLAPLLIFLGPAPYRNRPAEAEIRAVLARDLGVSPEAILTETKANTTREEVVRVSALLRPRRVRRILLVTDSQHMFRAQRLFERAGFEVLPAVADNMSNLTDSPEDRFKLTRRALQEILARVYYWVAGNL